ncbi:HAMP domain-containing sensor histidine kinase [Advenella sp. FME57]|uniref:HAMP domain-containing sensor histidine kinase n=1 Tax=Advenella sp. FME57 TaxID=2742604 RepID=UPI0018679AA3|nr:HAMP domain-containing sensor histidine kinase [Advenella sp. FME57]
MKLDSLTGKLLFTTTIALIITTAFVAILSHVVITYFPRVMLEADFAGNERQLTDSLVFDSADKPIAVNVNPGLSSVFEVLKDDAVYRVVDAQGKVLLASDDGAHAFAPTGQPFNPQLKRFDLAPDSNLLHVATFALTRPGPQYYVQVARSERFQQALTQNDGGTVRLTTLIMTLVALLIFSAIVLCTICRLMKPVQKVSLAASRINPGNLQARLATESLPCELVPLITAFNGALDRLANGYRVQQEFLATTAHELKTPLALMRGTVELGDSSDRAQLLSDIDAMSRQIQQLLQLAECSEPHNYIMAETDPAMVAADAIAKLDRLADSRDVAINTNALAKPMLIKADSAALTILIRNLLENAIQQAPPGTNVQVLHDENGVTVRDYGPGIDQNDLPMVFRRFWRGADSDGRSGLGLAICQQIAQAHGWTISVDAANPGAVFRVIFDGSGRPSPDQYHLTPSSDLSGIGEHATSYR